MNDKNSFLSIFMMIIITSFVINFLIVPSIENTNLQNAIDVECFKIGCNHGELISYGISCYKTERLCVKQTNICKESEKWCATIPFAKRGEAK